MTFFKFNKLNNNNLYIKNTGVRFKTALMDAREIAVKQINYKNKPILLKTLSAISIGLIALQQQEKQREYSYNDVTQQILNARKLEDLSKTRNYIAQMNNSIEKKRLIKLYIKKYNSFNNTQRIFKEDFQSKLKLKTDIISDNDAKKMLLEMGFNQDDLAHLKFNDYTKMKIRAKHLAFIKDVLDDNIVNKDEKYKKLYLENLSKKDVNSYSLKYLSEENFNAIQQKNKNLPNNIIFLLLASTNTVNKDSLSEIITNNDIDSENKIKMLRTINKYNKKFAVTDVINNQKISLDKKPIILDAINNQNQKIAQHSIIRNEAFSTNEKIALLNSINEFNKDIANKEVIFNDQIPTQDKIEILSSINKDNFDIATDSIIKNATIPTSYKSILLGEINKNNKEIAVKYIINNNEIIYPDKVRMLCAISPKKINLAHSIFQNDNIPVSFVSRILSAVNEDNIEFAKTLASDKNLKAIEITERLETTLPNKRTYNEWLDLKQDAFKNRHLLKTGTRNLSDNEIEFAFESEMVRKTLALIGKRNLESAFSLTIDGLRDACYEISRIKLENSEKEAILLKINPQNSKKFLKLQNEILYLKNELKGILGEEKIKEIQQIQLEKKKIENRISVLKQKYSNMDEKDKNSNKEILTKIKELNKEYKNLKNLGISITNSSNNAKTKSLKQKINLKNKEIESILSYSSQISPQDIVDKIRVISLLSEIEQNKKIKPMTKKFIELLDISTPEKNKLWNEELNKEIYKKINKNFNPVIANKLDLEHCKYISKMFISSEDFFDNFKNFVEIIEQNPTKSMQEIIDTLPQNKRFEEILNKYGISYEAWTKNYNSSNIKLHMKIDREQEVQLAIENIENNINDLLNSVLPMDVKKEIVNNLENAGFTFKDLQKDIFESEGFEDEIILYSKLQKNRNFITINDLPNIISTIKTTINNNEFWSQKNQNKRIEKEKNEFYTLFIKDRVNEIQNLLKAKKEDFIDIEIRKTNMYDVKNAIGLGNDSQCCTGLGKDLKEASAITYIKNKFVNSIEIVHDGNVVGNTMVYLAEVNGKLSLILDNIELKSRYQNNNNIRDGILEYAQKLCNEIGKPDMPIYASPDRHKLDMSVYPKNMYNIKLIGDSGSDNVYIDFQCYEHPIDDMEIYQSNMYKLK